MQYETQWNEISEVLNELRRNLNLYAHQMEAYELLFYLMNWIISYKNYSPVLAPKINEKVLNGLLEQLRSYRDMFRKYLPGWETTDIKAPLDVEDFVEELSRSIPPGMEPTHRHSRPRIQKSKS